MKKKILLSIAVAGLVFGLTGCGNSSSNSSTTSTTEPTQETTSQQNETATKSVKVVDGYVIGAQVCDANNVCATTDANGIATANFADTILTSKAGYIDVNYNNQIDDNDIKLPDTFTLKAPAGAAVVSPITDLIANGADTAKLAKILGISEDELYTDPIATNNVELAKAMQIVYAVKMDNKEAEFIQALNEENSTSTEEESNVASSQEETTSPLPEFKVVETNSSSSSLTAFANLALSVVTDENTKTLINQVVSLNVTDVKDIESSIVSLKKDLVQSYVEAENNVSNTNSTNVEVENNVSQTNTEENLSTSTQGGESNSPLPEF